MFGSISKKLGLSKKKTKDDSVAPVDFDSTCVADEKSAQPIRKVRSNTTYVLFLTNKPPDAYGIFPPDLWRRYLASAPYEQLKCFHYLSKGLKELVHPIMLSRRFLRLSLVSKKQPLAEMKELPTQIAAVCVAANGRIIFCQNHTQMGQLSSTFHYFRLRGTPYKQFEVKNLHAYGVACSSDRQVYITCRDPGTVARGFVAKLTEKGILLQQFGRKYLIQPAEIVIDAQDSLYVADQCALKVVCFAKDGTMLREIVVDSGSIPSGRERITALALNTSAGLLYELRPFQPIYTKSRIKVFKCDTGENLRTFDCDELASASAAGSSSSSNVSRSSSSSTAPTGNSADENFNKATQAANPKAIAVDALGRLLLADAWSRVILVFDANGNRIAQFKAPAVVGERLLRLLVLEDGSLFVQGSDAAVVI